MVNKYLVFIGCFVAGILIDYSKFENLGKTSFILILIFGIYFLYEKKFKSNNLLFHFLAFVVSGFVYELSASNVNLEKIFWYSFFYAAIIYFQRVIFAKKI